MENLMNLESENEYRLPEKTGVVEVTEELLSDVRRRIGKG